MTKKSHIFRRAGVLALLAMLMQVALPLLQPVMAAQAVMDSASGKVMRLCSMDQHAKDTSGKAQSPKTSCPICVAMHVMAGGYVPQQPQSLIATLRAVEIVASIRADQFVDAFVISSARPRAPPVSA